MIDAYADMMSRLSAIFAKHQKVLMGVNDHQRGPAAYSDGVGTTTARWWSGCRVLSGFWGRVSAEATLLQRILELLLRMTPMSSG